MEAVAAVRTVHFTWTGPHIADSRTSITAVTVFSLAHAKNGDSFDEFHHAASGTEEAAPHVGDEKTGADERGDDNSANDPLPGSEGKG